MPVATQNRERRFGARVFEKPDATSIRWRQHAGRWRQDCVAPCGQQQHVGHWRQQDALSATCLPQVAARRLSEGGAVIEGRNEMADSFGPLKSPKLSAILARNGRQHVALFQYF